MRSGAVTFWAAFLLSGLLGVSNSQAQISDGVVKIGVLNDQSGPYADIAGPGSVLATQMAAEDFGGAVLGAKIEVVGADHQNKPDVGSVEMQSKFGGEERPGASVYYKNGSGEIFHTYSTYSRGLDILIGAYNFLDLTPKGRDEEGLPHGMAWVRHHDRYQ